MASQELIVKVVAYVELVMSEYDASHDFEHIKRVVGGAHTIYNRIIETDPASELDLSIITLGALLHDIGDHKYLKDGEDGTVMVFNLLLALGADATLARKIQRIVNGVSFTNEIKHAAKIKELVVEIPELAVVQDADRLDAIGALGLARLFTFGGAKKQTPMQASMDLLDLKLFKIESYIKTEPGQKMAKVGTERLKLFSTWWDEEMNMGDVHWMPTLSEVGGALDAKATIVEKAAATEKATSDKKAELVEQFAVVEAKSEPKENADSKTLPVKEATVIEASSEGKKEVTLTEDITIVEAKSESKKEVTPLTEDVTNVEAKSGEEMNQITDPLAEQFDGIIFNSEGKANLVVDNSTFLAEQLMAIKFDDEGKENIKPKA